MVEKEQEKRQKKKKQSDRKIEIALGKQRKTFDREQKELTSKLTAALMLGGRLIVSGVIYWSRCIEGLIVRCSVYIGC